MDSLGEAPWTADIVLGYVSFFLLVLEILIKAELHNVDVHEVRLEPGQVKELLHSCISFYSSSTGQFLALEQSDGVDLIEVVDGHVQDKLETVERLLPENGVVFHEFLGPWMLVFNEEGLVQQIDQVAEGEQPGPSCHQHDPSIRHILERQSSASGAADMDSAFKVVSEKSSCELSSFVFFNHKRDNATFSRFSGHIAGGFLGIISFLVCSNSPSCRCGCLISLAVRFKFAVI